MHFAISPALRLAVRWGWLDRNPAEYVDDLPAMSRDELEVPTDAVVKRLLAAADVDFADFIQIAAATGARRGEICALRWCDVDLDRGKLRIAGSITEAKGRAERKEPKTPRSRRRVSIDSATIARLEARRDRVEVFESSAYVFADPNSRDPLGPNADLPMGHVPIRPSVWTSRWNRLCKKLDVHVRLHDLRHYHASTLLDSGIRIERVSARLGHNRTSTTFDVYAHLLDLDDSDLADVMDQRLR